MSENKDKNMKKKTLSLKLGTKPIIQPKKNIEAGKTVIVEKKRVKRSIGSEDQTEKSYEENTSSIKQKEVNNEIRDSAKSGVILKPLSKDEQKKILKAETKKDKNDAIEKIRNQNTSSPHNQNEISSNQIVQPKINVTLDWV